MPARMRVLVIAVVFVLLLAGCAGDAPDEGAQDPDGEDEGSDQGEAGTSPVSLSPPGWSTGDWWKYDISGVGPVTYVVTENSSSTWTIDVDDDQMAFWHTALEPISTVGPISKEDLTGEQGTQNVRFFDFPLEADKAWSLTWDGIPLTATVTAVEAGAASVEAVSEEGHLRTYSYDSAVGWFGAMTALDPNGTEEFSAELMDHGSDYVGEYTRWRLHESYRKELRPGDLDVTEITVGEDPTDIWFRFDAFCDPAGAEGDQGSWHFNIHPQSNPTRGFDSNEVCPATYFESGTMVAATGPWNIEATSTGGAMIVDFIPRTRLTLTLTDGTEGG